MTHKEQLERLFSDLSARLVPRCTHATTTTTTANTNNTQTHNASRHCKPTHCSLHGARPEILLCHKPCPRPIFALKSFRSDLTAAAAALEAACGDGIRAGRPRVLFRTTPEGNPWCNSRDPSHQVWPLSVELTCLLSVERTRCGHGGRSSSWAPCPLKSPASCPSHAPGGGQHVGLERPHLASPLGGAAAARQRPLQHVLALGRVPGGTAAAMAL